MKKLTHLSAWVWGFRHVVGQEWKPVKIGQRPWKSNLAFKIPMENSLQSCGQLNTTVFEVPWDLQTLQRHRRGSVWLPQLLPAENHAEGHPGRDHSLWWTSKKWQKPDKTTRCFSNSKMYNFFQWHLAVAGLCGNVEDAREVLVPLFV